MRSVTLVFAVLASTLSPLTAAQAQQNCRGLVGIDNSCTESGLVDRTNRIGNIIATSHVSQLGSPVSATGSVPYGYQRVTRGLTVQTVQPSAVQALGGGAPPVGPIRVCRGIVTCFRLR